MIKTLIYRELYLGRKNYIILAAIPCIFSGFCMLVALSTQIGNLANFVPQNISAEESAAVYEFMLPLISAFCFMCISISAHTEDSDYKSGWINFQYACPVKEESFVLAR